MTAYCIVVYNFKEETATVSQEAYRDYEQAERFIKSRSGKPIEVADAGCENRRTGIFVSKEYKYIIKEIRVI